MNSTGTRVARRAASDDFDPIVKLLQTEGLPTEDITPDLSHFFCN